MIWSCADVFKTIKDSLVPTQLDVFDSLLDSFVDCFNLINKSRTNTMIYNNIKLNAASTLFDFKINNLRLVHKYRQNTVDEPSNFEPSFVSILNYTHIYNIQTILFIFGLSVLISFHFFSLFFNWNI